MILGFYEIQTLSSLFNSEITLAEEILVQDCCSSCSPAELKTLKSDV